MSNEAPAADGHREQIILQLKAVAHMAKALAGVSEDFATALSNKDMPPSNFSGRRTAYQMEVLGDILNGMNAEYTHDEDAWLGPVFEEAQRLWPQEPSGDATELAAARAEIERLRSYVVTLEVLFDGAKLRKDSLEARIANLEAQNAKLRKSQLEFYHSAMSLLDRYNPCNMNEGLSQQWLQLTDACLRSGLDERAPDGESQ
jgi:hypothetical protein